MGKIRVERPHSFYGAVRTAKIFVDEVVVSEIKNKEEKIIDVARGSHTVKVGYGPFSGISNTLVFSLEENEQINIVFKARLVLYYILLFVSAFCGIFIYHAIVNENIPLVVMLITIVILMQIIQTTQGLVILAVSKNQINS